MPPGSSTSTTRGTRRSSRTSGSRCTSPTCTQAKQLHDPGAWFPAQGYAGHYCSVPTRNNPKIAGCSMILSGLRLFDISDVEHPREVAYFNKPVVKENKSGVRRRRLRDVAARVGPRQQLVWYTDTNSGFYVVRLTNGVQKLLPKKKKKKKFFFFFFFFFFFKKNTAGR